MDLASLHLNLFRMGNSESPSFSETRGLKDCLVVEVNGILVIRANGNGFSAFDSITPLMKEKGKNIWKIKKNAILPDGIRVVKDMRPNHKGHFMLAPERDMPFLKYIGLLEEFGIDPNKSVKLNPLEIKNG
ncbi:hypothetical protein [Massilia sp. CCM 8734]|uniref:Tse2 family ADP-ribosyltransferase toxin n=1 Tax=Massilia sp. CCM 8734 TaxID=2609283 RepID=UPI001AAFA7FF|nr:hypothetical protein [Massilia sp. CCM 8734]